MREILFRGKQHNGEWVYGHFYETIGNGKNVSRIYDGLIFKHYTVDRETVGQYTGLTDKNGKKIFEGDIIRVITFGFSAEMFITEVKFGAKSGVQGFYLANGRSMFYFGQKDLTVMDDAWVIGNIHDNPELLNGETK